jgi:hypothetical protein
VEEFWKFAKENGFYAAALVAVIVLLYRLANRAITEIGVPWIKGHLSFLDAVIANNTKVADANVVFLREATQRVTQQEKGP